MIKITNKQISEDLASNIKPTLYSNQPIPLNDLNDRCFEILLYSIFRERLKNKDPEVIEFADNVSLMQGVGEQGRDVIFSKNGLNTGLIQCKKYKSNLSKTEVAQEILKFLLYYIHDKTLIGRCDNFIYYFAVSTGFAGTTIGAFNNFGDYIKNEAKLKDWVGGIIKDYPKKFKTWKYEDVEIELKSILDLIIIRKIVPQDVEYWLSEFEALNKMFFRVLSVTDNTLLEKIIDVYLKPIHHKLDIQEIDTPDFSFRFKEYLKISFDTFSSAKTLVFGNQQKKLDEIYYPLTIVKKDSNRLLLKKREVHKIDKYKDELIGRYKKIIIIDDGGMGKSTLLKWLFLSTIKLNKGIPIFIELRKITPLNDILNEISKSLNPHNIKLEKAYTSKVLAEKGFLFLFDGYDEIKFENREFVTDELQNFITKCPFGHFVITSRPESALLAFSDFQEFSVRKLEKNEAFELIKKIDNYNERSQRLIQQIEENKLSNIEEFLGNPLLVSLLFKKFEYRETISFKKQEFFYEVFEALYQAHDLSKGGSFIRQKESNLSNSDFFQMLRGIGYECIKEGIEFNESQLQQLVEKVAFEFSLKFDSKLFLNDLTKAVPLFQKDGLVLKWAHKSLQQYFAAEYICRDSKEKQKDILIALYKSKRAQTYSNIIELCYEIDFRTFKKSVLKEFCLDFLAFSNKMFPNLKSKNQIPIEDIQDRCASIWNNQFFIHKLIEGSENEQLRKQISIKASMQINTDAEQVVFFGLNRNGHYSLGTFLNSITNFNLAYSLLRLKSDLIKFSSIAEDLREKVLKLPFHQEDIFFCDNDDPDSLMNSLDNFRIVNQILNQLLFTINPLRVIELLKELEIEEKEINNEEYLGF